MNQLKRALGLASCVATLAYLSPAQAELDSNCIVNVLNRTVSVSDEGGWSLPNVPANQGQVRARATCTKDDGTVVSGESDYFFIPVNAGVAIGEIMFDGAERIPQSIGFFDSLPTLELTFIDQAVQLLVMATYANGEMKDVTAFSSGTNYTSSNPAIASVSLNGVVTARGNGFAIVSARKDGVLATKSVLVLTSGDSDGDGLPDDYEVENGLNPADPVDAYEDVDKDGLSALEEFKGGTDPQSPDTDGDGITDGEETISGNDGFTTNPLLIDTDGDGINDSLEIALGFDPTDRESGDLGQALESLSVSPQSLVLTYNSIDGEASSLLAVTGHMLDGTEIDLNSRALGTTYQTSDITVANFGLVDGEVFAGREGTAQITVSNNGKATLVDVLVREFEPVALSSIEIPGYANNVVVQGDYAYVAAGAAGLQIVDVTQRSEPVIVGALALDGTAVDVKIDGTRAYVAVGEAGLAVVDVADQQAPVLLEVYDTAGFAQDLALQNDLVFLADQSMGLRILNVADSSNIFELGSATDFSQVTSVDVEGSVLAVAGAGKIGVYDISNPRAPLLLSSVNFSHVKNLDLDGGYLHVAAYSSGWRTFSIDSDGRMSSIAGDSVIVPRDVEVVQGLVFWAEQLFPNVTAFTNITNADAPFFQGTIDLTPAGGDYAGTGIAVDGEYVYITEEAYIVSGDYKRTGNTRLFIAQYRAQSDAYGKAPVVELTEPAASESLKVNTRAVFAAEAVDDVGVLVVRFYVEGVLVGEDTTYPYSWSYTVPPTPCNASSSLVIHADAVDFAGNVASSERRVSMVLTDCDSDGLPDQHELAVWETDPNLADTDGDGINDGEEVARGTNPNKTDTDGDGFSDKAEIDAGTDPNNPDTTAPRLLSSSPAADSVDAYANTPIYVEFDEELALTSVTPGSFLLLQDSSHPVSGRFQLLPGRKAMTFTPDGDLSSYTLYSVAISGLKDTAGNLMEPTAFNFKTGENPGDYTAPSVLTLSPASPTYGAPTNVTITAVLSERVDPSTVTTESFYILDTVTGENVDGSINVSADGTTLHFLPSRPLWVGRGYVPFLTSGIEDLSGNPLRSSNGFFETSFDPDTTAPEVVSTTVSDGAAEIPLNVKLNVVFSETVKASSISGVRLERDGQVVSVNRALGGQKITLVPLMPLEPNAEYVLHIDLVEDLSGNVLLRPMSLRFFTGISNDTTGMGGAQWWSIPDYTPEPLPTNPQLQVRLNDRVDPTSVVSATLYGSNSRASFRLYGGPLVQTVESDVVISDDGRTLTFHPREDLSPNSAYYVNFGYSTSFHDLAGNGIYGVNGIYFRTGSAEDLSGPVVTSASLLDGAESVPVSASVVLTFDDHLAQNSCPLADRVVVETGGVAVDHVVSLVGPNALKIIPTGGLQAFTTYTVSLAGVCDYSGNETSAQVLSFTTSDVVDIEAPELLDAVPAYDDHAVQPESRLTFTFSEDLGPGSRLTIYHPMDRYTDKPLQGETIVEGNALTFIPQSGLVPGSYSVHSGHVMDMAGNFASQSQTLTYFSVAAPTDSTPPRVIAISPVEGSLDIAPNSAVVVTFSEPLRWVNTGSVIVFYADGKLHPATVAVSLDRTTVTLTGLPGSSLVSVVINGAEDFSGNKLPAYIATFTTSPQDEASATRPNIASVVPAIGSVAPIGNRHLYLYSSEALDASTINDAFRIMQNNFAVSGSLDLMGAGRLVRFTADQPFEEGARIDFLIGSGALGINGNPLFNFSGFFTMNSSDAQLGSAPTPIGFFPESGAVDLPLNTAVYVLFNEEIEAATIEGNISLLDASGASVSIDVSIDASNPRLIRLQPTALLPGESTFTIKLTGNLADTDGDLLELEYESTFSTALDWVDDRQPKILAVSPTDGSMNIGVNTAYAVLYDEVINPLLFEFDGDRYDVQFSEENQVVRYRRFHPLDPEVEHAELAPSLPDAAGNTPVPVQTAFATAKGPDLEAPSVTESSIEATYSKEWVKVASNAVFEWYLSEAIDPVSLSASGVHLYSYGTSSIIEASLHLSDDGRRIEVVPSAPLANWSNYHLRARGVRDLSGNEMRDSFRYISSSYAEDWTPPSVSASSIVDGQSDVPLNARIRVRFDETLNALTYDDVVLRDSTGALIPVKVTLEDGRRVMQVTPMVILKPLTEYIVTLAGVEDLSRNVLPDTSITFTTSEEVDLLSGKVSWWSLLRDANNVPLNSILRLKFDERVDVTSLKVGSDRSSIQIVDRTTSSYWRQNGSFELDGDQQTLTISSSWGRNRTYDVLVGDSGGYWQFSPDKVYDLAGNAMSTYFPYKRFSTGSTTDLVPPSVTGASVVEGSVVAPTLSRIRLDFDEHLSRMCETNGAVTLLASGVAQPTTTWMHHDQKALDVLPSVLQSNTEYTIQVSGLCDFAGNRMPDQQVLQFATGE